MGAGTEDCPVKGTVRYALGQAPGVLEVGGKLEMGQCWVFHGRYSLVAEGLMGEDSVN